MGEEGFWWLWEGREELGGGIEGKMGKSSGVGENANTWIALGDL